MNIDNITYFKKEFFPLSTEDILVACADKNNTFLATILQEKPSLLYQILDTPAFISKKQTNILTHIFEFGNIQLLKKLIEVGLSPQIKDFLSITQYNILYNNNPNNLYSDQKILYQKITHSHEWNDLLELLFDSHILPENKIEIYYETVLHKPELLKKAFEEHYFDVGMNHYWENGFQPKKQGWLVFQVMNATILSPHFKNFFYQQFYQHALGEILYCNKQHCLYWPDLIIYHNDYVSLKKFINIDVQAAKNWFKHRQYFIEKKLLINNIFSCLIHHDMGGNWESIHSTFDNPWQFIKDTILPLTTIPVVTDCVILNTIDYTAICQSKNCFDILVDLIGFDSLIHSDTLKDSPNVIKNQFAYLDLKQKISEKLTKNMLKKKIIKI